MRSELVDSLRSLRNVAHFARVAGDLASFRSLCRAARRGSDRGTEKVGLRQLDGGRVEIRRGTTDPVVVSTTFVGRFHIPPRGLDDPRLIWDLGANIGLTMADLAHRYPQAEIVGVEMDRDNAEVARRNVGAWDARCEVLQGAVWPEDGEVHYRSEHGHEDGVSISEEGGSTAPAISLNTLLRRTGPPDYVKMDIEGAEEAVLGENTEWARAVRCIAVECHQPYSLERCLGDLEALGFDVYPLRRSLRRRAQDCAVGVRP